MDVDGRGCGWVAILAGMQCCDMCAVCCYTRSQSKLEDERAAGRRMSPNMGGDEYVLALLPGAAMREGGVE